MKPVLFILLLLCLYSCSEQDRKPVSGEPASHRVAEKPYDEMIKEIAQGRRVLAAKIADLNPQNTRSITDMWVTDISEKLYAQWQNTPWDFNGTATRPNDGSIACGYFVTTMLRDMDLKLNRNKLSICASSIMMKTLAPDQRLMNLSYLSYAAFNDSISRAGKGVYIIGLDSHTGFIVNDGKQNYFIHSNYIHRRGVTKEPVLSSAALHASKTRWMISLTADKYFLQRWLKGQSVNG